MPVTSLRRASCCEWMQAWLVDHDITLRASTRERRPDRPRQTCIGSHLVLLHNAGCFVEILPSRAWLAALLAAACLGEWNAGTGQQRTIKSCALDLRSLMPVTPPHSSSANQPTRSIERRPPVVTGSVVRSTGARCVLLTRADMSRCDRCPRSRKSGV